MKKKSSSETSLVVEGILGFLSDSGKSNLLSSVTRDLEDIVEQTKSAEEIEIISSVALTQTQLSKIAEIVNSFLHRDLPSKNIIDKKIIGGIMIKVGDFFLDASIAHELENVKNIIST